MQRLEMGRAASELSASDLSQSGEFIGGDSESCMRPDYVQLVVAVVVWLGKVLLIYRHTEPFAGQYSIPGGHLELGESYVDAARRELQEETGIVATTLQPLPIFIDHNYRLECHGFRFNSPNGEFVNPDGEEQEVIGWKTLDEAIKLPLTPGLHEFLMALNDSMNK